MNIFEKASRLKLRFKVGNGQCTTDDLWDLTLDQLETLASQTDNAVKETGKSFFKTKSKANEKLELQLEIIKHIGESKMAEKEAKAEAAAKAEKRAVILEMIEKKKIDALGSKSVEELEKELAELEK